MGLDEYYRLRNQLIDMTECRDALQQALEIVKAERDEAQKALADVDGLRRRVHLVEGHNQWFERCESAWCHPTEKNNPALGYRPIGNYHDEMRARAESAEATIREQSERIKELEAGK